MQNSASTRGAAIGLARCLLDGERLLYTGPTATLSLTINAWRPVYRGIKRRVCPPSRQLLWRRIAHQDRARRAVLDNSSNTLQRRLTIANGPYRTVSTDSRLGTATPPSITALSASANTFHPHRPHPFTSPTALSKFPPA